MINIYNIYKIEKNLSKYPLVHTHLFKFSI